MSRRFVGELPNIAIDLIELATYVYGINAINAINASVSCGGLMDQHMAEKLGAHMLKHIPLRGGTNSGGTHRARSFLFAALGMATAVAFRKDRVSFYENSVVSLNLPPVGNVLVPRATRATHPPRLQRVQTLFSRIFKSPLRVDNPLMWRTKTNVIETIARLGMGGQIAFTRSCADVHNQIKQYAHCGRCSQCIDRRFAIFAAGLEAFDPGEAYQVDLMSGRRERVQGKEVVLSYVRNAHGYEVMTGADLMTHYPAILNAVAHTGEPPDTVLERIAGLPQWHGRSIAAVMRAELESRRPEQFPADSPEPLWRNAADAHLAGAGQGLDLLDYPTIDAGKLAERAGLLDDAALRQSLSRSRKQLGVKFASAGFASEDGEALIENIPWSGYRLNPGRVKVRMVPPPVVHSARSKPSSPSSGTRLRNRAIRSI